MCEETVTVFQCNDMSLLSVLQEAWRTEYSSKALQLNRISVFAAGRQRDHKHSTKKCEWKLLKKIVRTVQIVHKKRMLIGNLRNWSALF